VKLGGGELKLTVGRGSRSLFPELFLFVEHIVGFGLGWVETGANGASLIVWMRGAALSGVDSNMVNSETKYL
jgi:hypothetical protein